MAIRILFIVAYVSKSAYATFARYQADYTLLKIKQCDLAKIAIYASLDYLLRKANDDVFACK